jgi:hypothetical protein
MGKGEKTENAGIVLMEPGAEPPRDIDYTLGADAPPEDGSSDSEEELLRAESLLVGAGKEENYYSFYGLTNFQSLSEPEIASLARRRDRLVALAEAEWGSNPRMGERLVKLNREIVRSCTKLTQQKEGFDKDLRALLLGRLGIMVDQCLKSNQTGTAAIEIEEYRSIMEEYEAKGVLSPDRPDGVAAFHRDLRKLVDERKGEILDHRREFIEYAKTLSSRDLLDIPEKRAAVAAKYRALRGSAHYIETLRRRTFTEQEVMPEVDSALASAGLAFRKREEVFEEEAYAPFEARLGLRGGGQIDSFNFGQMVVRANDEYSLSEDEVRAFCDARGVSVKSEVELRFNLGFTSDRSRKLEAKSYEEIVALFEEFPDKARSKIYDGDLEVYLDNLGNFELRDSIKRICEEYAGRDEMQAGLRKTIYTLLPAKPFVTPKGTACRGLEELGDAIEDEIEAFRRPLLAERNHEALLFLEARGAMEAAHEVRVWAASGRSEQKRLNGIVWVLQGKVFKRAGRRYVSVDQVINLADPSAKTGLALELSDTDSKMSVWIEECFGELAGNVEKWRSLKRWNDVTIDYALEAKSPFRYGEARAFTSSDFVEGIIRENALDEAFLDEFLDNASSIRAEAEFWLKEYHSTDGIAALRSFLAASAKDQSFRKANDKVVSALSDSYTKRGFKQYWEDLLPAVEEARNNKAVGEETYGRHRDALVKLAAENASSATDDRIHRYIKDNLASPDIDKELILALFRYFMRESIGRAFYAKKVQPLLEKAVEKGVADRSLLDEQKAFFLSKYERELASASFDEKLSIIEAMKALDANHPLVRLYEDSAKSIKQSVRAGNVLDRARNALKRDFLLALASIAALGCSLLPFLRRIVSWRPVEIDVAAAGKIAFLAILIALVVAVVARKKRRR